MKATELEKMELSSLKDTLVLFDCRIALLQIQTLILQQSDLICKETEALTLTTISNSSPLFTLQSFAPSGKRFLLA